MHNIRLLLLSLGICLMLANVASAGMTPSPTPSPSGSMSQAQARRLASNRIRKLYARVPPWLQHTAPGVRLSTPLGPRANASTGPQDHININPATTLNLAGANGQSAQKEAQVEFLHELVHANQRRGLSFWLSEGSAQSIAQHQAHKIFGYTPSILDQAYAPQVARTRQVRGLRRRVLDNRPAPGPLDFLK